MKRKYFWIVILRIPQSFNQNPNQILRYKQEKNNRNITKRKNTSKVTRQYFWDKRWNGLDSINFNVKNFFQIKKIPFRKQSQRTI